jgi:SRSO17 transposase
MSDHAVAALRKRREEISGQVHDAEKRVTKLRAALANLDAAIAILTPEHADYVAPRRHYSRTAYFKRGELSRLVREAMRDAGKPLAAGEIAAGIIAAKRFPDAAHLAVTKMIVGRLGVLAKRGEIAKTGKTRDARWVLMSCAAPPDSE